MSVEISFPSATSGDANILVRELRSELAENGVAPGTMKYGRSNSENMDVASLLFVGMEAIVAVHSSFEIAKVILNFAKRTQSVVKIKSPAANIDISTNSVDAVRLGQMLEKLAGQFRDATG